MEYEVLGLSKFLRLDGLPQDEAEKRRILQSDAIKLVICFCLGPEGTNIAQAARRWLSRMGINQKSEIRLRPTPEACLEGAREVKESGVLAVFWTCAVYSKESEFFFTNPDILPFYFQELMDLDSMQLAIRQELLSSILGGKLPSNWRVASHPSPQYLVRGLVRGCGWEIILVNSNAAAAQYCAERKSQACITTEAAREIHNLITLHVFGSPPMVFFGGITPRGVQIIKSACAP
jgi:hypothetical protein